MKIAIITLFPEMFAGVFEHSMLFKAQDKQLVEITIINLRDYGIGPRQTVDDSPYGGGDGMLLKPEPLFAAVEDLKQQMPKARVLLMTPRGRIFNQTHAQKMAGDSDDLIIVCGRYEGYDERITTIVDDELSVGRYVLTGGEIPAMLITDAVVRLIPGVLGGEASAEIESYSQQDLERVEFPQYTRPEEFRGMKVPDVLLSGNHAEIEKWRSAQSDERSKQLQSEA
jgi:tRNA (guanine37-N1)-methyltransferase